MCDGFLWPWGWEFSFGNHGQVCRAQLWLSLCTSTRAQRLPWFLCSVPRLWISLPEDLEPLATGCASWLRPAPHTFVPTGMAKVLLRSSTSIIQHPENPTVFCCGHYVSRELQDQLGGLDELKTIPAWSQAGGRQMCTIACSVRSTWNCMGNISMNVLAWLPLAFIPALSLLWGPGEYK